VSSLSWSWIALALTVPPALGLLVAWPMWRMEQPIFGNIAGSVVIFGAAIALIMRENVELDTIAQACLAKGVTCFPEPSAFARHAIYAVIGLVEVIAIFLLSLRYEEKLRRRGYAPEWR
jgi:hypothetical protein